VHYFSKLFAASTLAVLGLAVRAEDSTAPTQAPSATAEPIPAPAQNGAPAASPGKGSLYYKPGERPQTQSYDATGSTQRSSPGHHHRGFYVRVDGGAAYQVQSWTEDSIDYKYSDLGVSGGVSFGSAIAEDVIFGGRIFFGVLSKPSYSVGGVSQSTNASSVAVIGGGPELVYYFMPIDMYVSVTLAVTRQMREINRQTGSTDPGFGAQIMLGKEWMIGERLGLGFAGQASCSFNSSDVGSLSLWNAGLVASVTYN
jgi:hypothetical protein